jgi:hypothetical protein
MRVVKVELTRSVTGTTRLIKEEEALVEVMEVAAAGVVVVGVEAGVQSVESTAGAKVEVVAVAGAEAKAMETKWEAQVMRR